MPAKQKSEMLTRRQEKARKARQKAVARRSCTDVVWGGVEVQHGNCSRCSGFVLRSSESPHHLGHVHELIPRSRGGDPTDPANCVLLCASCHALAHGLVVHL